MIAAVKPPEQLERLALSLSGGGVRAVGFHLGTLDILHRLGLLGKVHSLSSSSGGSMVALGYVLSCVQHRGFDKFFGDFFRFMPKLNTMQGLAMGMNDSSVSGRRTVVGAMAQIYRNAYFKAYYRDPKFGALLDGGKHCHLDNLIVNATDFKTGQTFRFRYRQNAGEGHQLDSGSQQVRLPHELAAEFYVSDIMTASACLPGLLEPMFLPDDFRFDEPQGMKESLKPILKDCDVSLPYLAIMDGGIVDNQGISSIIYALLGDSVTPLPTTSPWEYARVRRDVMHRSAPADSPESPADALLREVTNAVDLFIVSDAPEYRPRKAQYFPKQDLLGKKSEPPLKKFLYTRRLKTAAYGFYVLFVAGLAAVIASAYGLLVTGILGEAGFFANIWQALSQTGRPELAFGLAVLSVVGLLVLIVTTLIGVAIFIGARWVKKSVEKYVPEYEKIRGEETEEDRKANRRKGFWRHIGKLQVGDVVYLLRLRALSVFSLVAEIFMNRVRQLSYIAAIETEELKDRVLPVEIFKLRDRADQGGNAGVPEQSSQVADGEPPGLPKCPKDLEDIVKNASDTPTKLFVSREELDHLVIAGQATTCFCLMEFILRHRAKTGDDSAFTDLFDAVEKLWNRIANAPGSLLAERLAADPDPSGPRSSTG